MDHAPLAEMTVKDLRALAAARGVPGAARMRKEELLAALLAAGSVAPAAAASAPSSTASSSSASAPAPAPAALPGPSAEAGLPIPASYGHDRLVLLVQDPHHLFAYWEITPHTLERVARAAGDGTPVLVIESATGTEQREVDLRGGNYYLAVAPSGTYRAGLALRDREGRLHPLALSNQVSTPPAAPSQRTDEEWMGVEEAFHELLARAALPGAPSSAAFAAGADQRLSTWAWKVVPVTDLSSAQLLRARPTAAAEALPMGAGNLSSSALSSGALGSHSVGSHSFPRPPAP